MLDVPGTQIFRLCLNVNTYENVRNLTSIAFYFVCWVETSEEQTKHDNFFPATMFVKTAFLLEVLNCFFCFRPSWSILPRTTAWTPRRPTSTWRRLSSEWIQFCRQRRRYKLNLSWVWITRKWMFGFFRELPLFQGSPDRFIIFCHLANIWTWT